LVFETEYKSNSFSEIKKTFLNIEDLFKFNINNVLLVLFIIKH